MMAEAKKVTKDLKFTESSAQGQLMCVEMKHAKASDRLTSCPKASDSLELPLGWIPGSETPGLAGSPILSWAFVIESV